MTQHKIDPDALIFDMDGTLWDAVDSYCKIWDTTFKECGIPHDPVTRADLIAQMGKPLEDIIITLAPNIPDLEKFLVRLDHNEKAMMPVLGGRFYPEVRETIAALAPGRKLFMVSNCGTFGLDNMMHLAGITQYITEALTHGGTGRTKTENNAYIVAHYGLKSPYYVGDTQGDAAAAITAGCGIIWAAYGFGHVDEPNYTINCFKDLTSLIVLH